MAAPCPIMACVPNPTREGRYACATNRVTRSTRATRGTSAPCSPATRTSSPRSRPRRATPSSSPPSRARQPQSAEQLLSFLRLEDEVDAALNKLVNYAERRKRRGHAALKVPRLHQPGPLGLGRHRKLPRVVCLRAARDGRAGARGLLRGMPRSGALSSQARSRAALPRAHAQPR